ncbi:hypothetical protein NC653_034834 [Populus alba x Populus x berolinensis]|uniref:Uncharacterized protein n=1 Tax=Populus alba x Populus x berolinensis TaxID=444605 RepID=A0AAD6LNJ9_9ROSI|nr:hypothetical protein NC653_034834 [Populus alba x Populus x berolinensis]
MPPHMRFRWDHTGGEQFTKKGYRSVSEGSITSTRERQEKKEETITPSNLPVVWARGTIGPEALRPFNRAGFPGPKQKTLPSKARRFDGKPCLETSLQAVSRRKLHRQHPPTASQ